MNLLIFPPFADPTQSYPSLPILQGHLKSEGINVAIRDWNIEGHLELLKKKGFSRVIEIFQSPDLFYREENYQEARQGLESFYQCLSDESGEYLMSNNSHFYGQGPWNIKRLSTYWKKQKSPFTEFYHESLSKLLKANEVHHIGLSCTFVSQLPETFYLAMLIKKHYPLCKILGGGPALAQVVEAVEDDHETLKQLLQVFDAICFDEGELTLSQLFSPAAPPIENIPNLLYLRNNKITRTKREKLHPEDFALPDFSGIDLDSYLAPSRIILYNPSRGCYWNRCSFCHYGFNQVDGVGYREVSAHKAVSQIKELKEKYQVANFYFSSDVLSPRFAKNFSTEALAQKLNIFWSTDLRIEKNYSADLCQLLAEAGMVSVAFGIESGSGSLLALIDKGITPGQIVEINKNFSDAGIATCWMTFNYHPKETIREALETLDLIETQKDKIALFIAGEFGLTVGSKIYRHPKDYGLKKIFFHPEDQFKIYPYFEMANLLDLSQDDPQRIDRRLRRLSKHFNLSPYPFKGAISTHHSFLYFKNFGKDVFH